VNYAYMLLGITNASLSTDSFTRRLVPGDDARAHRSGDGQARRTFVAWRRTWSSVAWSPRPRERVSPRRRRLIVPDMPRLLSAASRHGVGCTGVHDHLWTSCQAAPRISAAQRMRARLPL